MLRLGVSARLLCLATAICVALQAPVPAFSQEPPPSPPPPSAPPPQTQPPEKQQPAAEKPPGDESEAAHDESEAAESKAPAPKGATLHGKVTAVDRKSPIPGAQVHAIPKDGRVVSSPPADNKGRYRLTGLAPGSYHLAVSTEEGVFTLESEVGISSANDYTVDLATIPAEAASGVVPGLDLGPAGFAAIVQGKKGGGGSFWGSAKGITLLVVSAAALALILTQGDNSEEESAVSPSLP